MTGWSATVVFSILTIVCSCSEPEPDTTSFLFSAFATVDPSVDEVLVDGASHPLSVDGGGRALRFERNYSDYLTAQDANPIRIEFLVGGVIRRSGVLRPGACAQTCPPQLCPADNSLQLEDLLLPPDADFQPYEYVCMNCVGDSYSVPACL